LSPTSVASAKLSTAWTASMMEELEYMERFGVWKLVPPPAGANIIGCKWIFRTKFDKCGLPSRLKSRLTAKGFTQRKGVDYLETWAPTCRHRSFRMMLAEASTIPTERLVTSAWDTTAAFLHADMDHVAYMQQPPGFEDPDHPDHVCRLYKSIYGLKSSSRLFYLMLRDHLVGPKIKAQQSETDHCVFVVRGPGDQFMKLALWVDDIAVVSNSQELYDKVFAELVKHFAFRAEPLEHFLGFVIDRRADGSFTLSQWPYIKELITKLGFDSLPTAESPEAPGASNKLRKSMCPTTAAETEAMADVPYRTATGALFWIARSSRPDIYHAVSMVAKFSSNPGVLHWKAVARIFAYLKRTLRTPLVLSAHGGLHVEAYSDSDFAGDPDTAKSTTGFLVRAGSAAVAFGTRTQTSWAQNVTEAEYLAALRTSNEVVWWRNITSDVWPEVSDAATEIWVDNEGAIMQSQHPTNFDASKHYTIASNVLRQRTTDKIVVLKSIRTDFNIADIFTKVLSTMRFKHLASALLGSSVM
jgi:hypothetical protein